MNKIYACIDGRTNTHSVIDWSAWAALKLDVPLEFLHVLERHPDRSATKDFSGAIGLGAQENILQDLSDSDAHHSKAAIQAGLALLTEARARSAAAGVALLDGRLRHGEFVPTVQEMEPDARMFVLGEHYHAAHSSKVHLDHQVEQVIRGTRRSVLVATRAQFNTPARFAVAFDGSASAFKTIEAIKDSALLSGMSVRLFMAGAEAPQRLRLLEEARQALATAGFDVMAQFSKGEPHVVLPALVLQQDVHLLVIGAFGHSWLRQLVSGSTTSTLLRVSDVPVLVLR